MNNCIWDFWQITKQTLYLSRHPAHSLALEVVLVANLLIEDVDIWCIFDENFLAEKKSLHFTILPSCGELKDIIFEKFITKTHTRPNQCGGQP